MGEVYRAKDGKLGRDVAIKVLPDAFAENEERLARFKREAMVLASLNHPNIGAIYGLEEADSLWFLVLELVPGETLAERLRRGPIPFAEALELAGQIADALAAAHDNGVIHRDLKPANIKITPEGQIKVLDFGLAKALADEPADGQLSDSPTLSAHATKVGVILGTAAYMSPEQARGKAVDKRTDIFSFGAVLYEMLSGRQLFKGEDAADTMASVIRSDPDFRSLPAEIPPRVREILGRCLEKDPKKRRRDIGDIRTELEAPREPVAVETQERRSRRWLPVAGAAALSLATGIAGWHLKPDPPRPLKRFEMVLPEGDAFSGASRHIVVMSPQATHLVYVANNQFYLRALEECRKLPAPRKPASPSTSLPNRGRSHPWYRKWPRTILLSRRRVDWLLGERVLEEGRYHGRHPGHPLRGQLYNGCELGRGWYDRVRTRKRRHLGGVRQRRRAARPCRGQKRRAVPRPSEASR